MVGLSQQLLLHGSLVLLAGFVGGCFFTRAIKRAQGEVAWRVVHSGSSMGGVMLIALGAAWPQLAASGWLASLVAWSLIAGVEVFVLAMFWAAVSGSRGLSRGGAWSNRGVNALYLCATVLSLTGCGLLVYCAAKAA